MSISQEIATRVEQLPPALQEQVLRFVSSLGQTQITGIKPSELLKFANTLDPQSAAEMERAIEEGCEQIDHSQW